MPIVFLIRHGLSQSNVGLPTSDPKEVELTARGREQSEQVARFLTSNPSLDLIVTSPYLRSQQTAEPTIQKFPLTLTEVWDVQEFTYLWPAYHSVSTAEQRRPIVQAYWEQLLPFYVDGPGAESFAAFMARAQAFLDRLREEQYEDKTIAVFSHEQFMHAVLWLIDNSPIEISPDTMQCFRDRLDGQPFHNGAIVQMRYSDHNARWLHEPIMWHLNLEHLVGETAAAEHLVVETAAAGPYRLKYSEPEPDPPQERTHTPDRPLATLIREYIRG